MLAGHAGAKARSSTSMSMSTYEHLVEQPGHPHRAHLGGTAHVHPVPARPADVLGGVGEAVQPDLGHPLAREPELDQLPHGGAVTGTSHAGAPALVAYDASHPPL